MSNVDLENLLVALKDIKTYLVKIGPERRNTGTILGKKVEEAKETYKTLDNIIGKFKELKEPEVSLAKNLCSQIRSTYKDILKFLEEKAETESTMAAFDIKTAVSLLPVMNGSEEVTNQLIDAIQLYESMLDENGKRALVQFVLKTRLSHSAKIRLESNYNSVNLLVQAMKTHLLTQKSDTALQLKLMQSKQGGRSVEKFGKELEELFVDLTIAQAKGDNNSYAVLKPLNEKLAIKRFSDGLNNDKISTIVAARNFTYLKDAIRAAQDEELSVQSNPGSSQVMSYSNRGRSSNGRYNKYRNDNRRGNQGNRGRNNYNNSNNGNRYNNNNRGNNYNRGSNSSSSSNRGNNRGNNNNRYNNRRKQGGSAYVIEDESNSQNQNTHNEMNQFFRENSN